MKDSPYTGEPEQVMNYDMMGGAFPIKKVHKEQDILCKNRELFNVNQSKSIYLSKITQLIDTEISPKQRVADKISKKLLSDSSEEPIGNPHQQKLARNRQSARDSRKRKKIYIELLENKVEDLSQEIVRLETIITNQSRYINYCAKIPSQIKEFHISYQNSLAKLKNESYQISVLDQEYGVASMRRLELCTQFFNTLVDFTLPADLKKMMESAVKGFDFFQDENLSSAHWSDHMQMQWKDLDKVAIKELRQRVLEQTSVLEFYLYDFAKQYEKIRQQSMMIEILKQDVIKLLTPQVYSQYLLNIDETLIKEEP